MIYYLYTLKFFSPVHFGDAVNGGRLDRIALTCSADTYFSALINEASSMDFINLETLIAKFQKKDIVLSSLFPYSMQNEELELYLPKPLVLPSENNFEIKNYQEMKTMATKMKKNKKALYIRTSDIGRYLTSVKNGENFTLTTPGFAVPLTTQKVNCRYDETLPYFVGGYRFYDNAGLYFIAGFASETDVEQFNLLVESLGYSGIGGKKSSGFGKYELLDDPIEISKEDKEDYIYQDDLALAKMFANNEYNLYMNIAPISPDTDDIKIIKDGVYKVIKRSGFVYSANLTNNLKKKDIYMLAEGSTFAKMLKGKFIKETINNLSHDIYRNGMGLFVGLNYE